MHPSKVRITSILPNIHVTEYNYITLILLALSQFYYSQITWWNYYMNLLLFSMCLLNCDYMENLILFNSVSVAVNEQTVNGIGTTAAVGFVFYVAWVSLVDSV